MARDQLSEVLDLVEVRGQLTGGFAVSGRWQSHSPGGIPLKYVAVVQGGAELTGEQFAEPVLLTAGDVIVLREPGPMRAQGGHGSGPVLEVDARDDFLDLCAPGEQAEDVFVGGRIDLDESGRAVLLQALPEVVLLPASSPATVPVRRSLQRLVEEVRSPRLGSAFAIRHCAQMLVLDVLRACLDEAELPPGLLRLLADEQLRPALELMHSDLARTWSVTQLARAAAMSRTAFAQRFRTVAGIPPGAYLRQRRMSVARRELRRPGSRLLPIASRLGYGSESAFSAAFSRETGESPQAYRRRAAPALEVG